MGEQVPCVRSGLELGMSSLLALWGDEVFARGSPGQGQKRG